METKNHVIVNVSNCKWGRGANMLEAMQNAKAKKSDKMYYYIFKNDNWDIWSDGRVLYDKKDLIFTQTINHV